MKRKPTFTTSIGSISGGTMRPEDLIPTFAYELRSLLQKCRVDRNTRKAHVKLLDAAEEYEPDNSKYMDAADGLLDELFDALDHYSPPYCCFGANEGDGAAYGFWPVSDVLEGEEIPRLVAGYDHREHWGEDVLLVNDHGNVECGRFDKRGRWHEYWSCV